MCAIIAILVVGVIIAIYFNRKEKSQIVYNDNVIENMNIIEQEENQVSNEISEENTTVSSSYYIKVNYQANVVTVYKKESNGELTPIKAMTCSCGTATPTSGVYKTSDKYEWGWLIGGVYGQYSTRIVGGILFHSVPYTAYKDKGSLEYWEYDKLGTTASAGCVRLTAGDAKWIYTNCPKATQVEFYASADPGPLGKPAVQKISDNTECRNWDPTDNVSNNPWLAWNKNKEVKN